MDFTKIRHLLFFVLLAVISVIFLLMVKPFAYPIFWAAIIAGLFYPFFKWLDKKIKLPSLSTTIVLSVILVVIIIPLFFLGFLLAKESAELYNSLSGSRGQINTTIQNISQWIKYNPFSLQFNFDEKFWSDKFTESSAFVANAIIQSATGITQNSLRFLAMFVIMFYALFFFLRDGEKMMKKIMHLCPLGDKYEKVLYQKFTSTARAALKGTLIVGGIQGALGAILFWYVGIQGALIWGLVMMALSIIPPFSAAIIWLPAAIILMLTGSFWSGLLVLIAGIVLISTIDNLLRPYIVGKDTKMHPLLVLFSTLGGIIVFGISGFIIGPVLTALFMAFWEMYEQYYKNELCNNK